MKNIKETMDALMAPVTMHLDEIDAARIGEQFLREQAAKYSDRSVRRLAQKDDGAQALELKIVSLLDGDDRMLATYILNRDRKNWTQLTLVACATG